jgi:fumarate hydratase subunit beta
MKQVKTPLTDESIKDLRAGDEVLLSGIIYTARDQAHKRMCEMLDKGEKLPVDLAGEVLYYCGPTPSGNRPIGSCGPTTSGRMDPFSSRLMEEGMKAMIGKGKRSAEVVKAIKDLRGVYFVTPGGAGAYLSEKVRSSSCAAFADLGAEAVYRLEVEDFPLIVAIDSRGNNLYDRM